MKLLSITVPCYNSQDYMEHCVNSLLTGGEDVEIILVDDGSSDRTAEIADRYAENYPTIVKVIHKENGGHGSGVNAGIANATGKYFKVVDSDDWVDTNSYKLILEKLREFVRMEKSEVVDLLISNFVYDKEGASHKKVMQYTAMMPQNRIFEWKDMKRIKKGKYILMHSIIYRTEVLRQSGLKLPEHTFYVDNLFAYNPLPYVKHLYYLNTDFYHYYIGREDQSVNEAVMIKRIDQQIYVNKLMMQAVDLKKDVEDPKLRKYMYNYLEIITTISTVLLNRAKTPEAMKKKKKLWKYMYNYNPKLYFRMRNGIIGRSMTLPGEPGRMISVGLYKVAQKIYGFN
jgi:glycosyltransferase involved in cell wall biosynthesis